MTSALRAMDRPRFVDWAFGHYLNIAPPSFVSASGPTPARPRAAVAAA